MNIEEFIDTLNFEQKQAAFDLLWVRLSRDPTRLSSPAWHDEVLAHREANPSDKPRLSLPNAKTKVQQMINERRSTP